MPKLSGLFSNFSDLDSLDFETIRIYSKTNLKIHEIENFIANRFLYPQTIPSSILEMKLDLSAIKEIIKKNIHLFYNNSLKRITIPEGFEERLKPVPDLIITFIDAISPPVTTQIILKYADGSRKVGSVYIPQTMVTKPSVELTIDQQTMKLKNNVISRVNCAIPQTIVTLEGQNPETIWGGDLGIFVDLRQKV